MESPEAAEGISDGDRIEVDTDSGEIRDLTTGAVYKASAFPEFIGEIISSDGLVGYTKSKLSKLGERHGNV